MDLNRLPTAVPEVIHQRLPDGAVLFLPAAEVYYGLNEVGSVVWSLLPPATATFAELCDRLSERYPDAARSDIEVDVRELLDDLLEQRLVHYANESSGRSDGPNRAAS